MSTLRHLGWICPSCVRRSVAQPSSHLKFGGLQRSTTTQSIIPRPRRTSQPLRTPFPSQARSYYQPGTSKASPYPPIETKILSHAISRVPEHGFTDSALVAGCVDAGYLPSTTNLFSYGSFDLILYHLVTSRSALADLVQFPSGAQSTPRQRLQSLMMTRLLLNAPIRSHLPEALAIMAMPSRVPASLAELARLADEFLYLAGDTSVDSSWYTKRAGVSAVYASSEVFMTQDTSEGFKETKQFLERRIDEGETVNYAVDSTVEWLSFEAMTFVNVARSWGMRI